MYMNILAGLCQNGCECMHECVHCLEGCLNHPSACSGILMHCKKERVILTNFGHLSCTPLCSKSLSKVCQKFACTSNLLKDALA